MKAMSHPVWLCLLSCFQGSFYFLSEVTMIYYTADLHFASVDIIDKAGRPFSTTEEMDETLIRNWNAVVSADDTVYLVGDIGNHALPFPEAQLAQLRGHKHLIRGNHDTCIENQEHLLDYFETVTDFLEIDDGAVHITLCHYPLVYIQNGYMIHGHLHNAKKKAYRILTQLPRNLNAGVDINDFYPVTLEQLIENNRRFYADAERGCLALTKDGTAVGMKWKARFHPLPQRKPEKGK